MSTELGELGGVGSLVLVERGLKRVVGGVEVKELAH